MKCVRSCQKLLRYVKIQDFNDSFINWTFRLCRAKYHACFTKFGYRKNLVDYRIIDSSANFSSSLKNFQVQLYINKIRDYASLNEISINTTSSFLIKDVLNTTTLILDTPFTYNNKVATITNGSYKIVYNDNYITLEIK